MAARWDEIPLDIAQKIGEQIDMHEDLIAFGEVCRWWRQAMKLASRTRASRQTPWLMLAEPPCTLKRRFYGIYKGTLQHLELPNPRASNGDCMYLSASGWLVCVTQQNLNLVLIEPISGRVIQPPLLPNYYSLNNYQLDDDLYYMSLCSKCALLGNPLITTTDYTLGVISCNKIGLWSSKDDKWVVQPRNSFALNDITFYKGTLYSIADKGQVIAYNNVDGCITERMVANLDWPMTHPGAAYVVELAGALVVIYRVVEAEDRIWTSVADPDIEYKTVNFKVWEVNVENGKVKQVKKHLRNNKAVFVGFNSSFSVEAFPPFCKPNCIYYTDDLTDHYELSSRGGGSDIGVFDLSSGKVTQDFLNASPGFSFATPPLWVEASPSASNLFKLR